MSEKIEDKTPTETPVKASWAGAATLAGAAIGSAALAAALIFVSRRKAKPTDTPTNPEHAHETD